MTRGWRGRLLSAGALVVVGYGALELLDLDPRPFDWTLLCLLGCSVVWLVVDTLDAERAAWFSGLPPRGDRVEDAGPDQRLVENHVAASRASPALRDRLVELARTRDPALADPDLAALAASPPRRLSAAEIDHYLNRIEALRDRS